mmetsp:Transcript_46388/g.123236  ORF Transcript_46388/g.123236 Transcript_46388/m.123236 type:complete len:221 (-) Transcript_46388:113-775(-)
MEVDSQSIVPCEANLRVDVPVWLPSVSARVVLPFETCAFRVTRPSACAAVRLAEERGLPLAAVCGSIEQWGEWGTALQVDVAQQFDSGGLLVHVRGLRPFRIVDRGTMPHRRRDSSKPELVNLAAVQWVWDDSNLRKERCQYLCAEILGLIKSSHGYSMVSDAPSSVEHVSWWAPLCLPLPALARAPLLRITNVEERLSVCAAVLRILTRGDLQGRRAKL